MIRILLVDDHAVVRAGYRRFLDAEPDFTVIAEAATADDAYALLSQGNIDLAIVDINLGASSGIEAIRRMLLRQSGLKVLVFSMHNNPLFVTQAMRVGALGYITKNSEPSEMIDAIRRVAIGQKVLSSEIAQTIAKQTLEQESLMSRLTPREFEVLRMMVKGESTNEIATAMHLSPKTIFNYLSLIRQKLEAENDFQLLWLAIRYGVVDSN
ncbi:response regulator [Ampullimonas aquatilis]|uniref:response regulator n=1 Tax=Ampullimonas aquatilis TaxID=1341549 RepID=UPI003C7399C4